MTGWTPTPTYWVGPVPREHHRLTTSATELTHLTVAFLVLTVDIALVEGFLTLGRFGGGIRTDVFLAGIGFAAVAALSGFVAHEMAHKVTAQRYGFWAEFRMSPVGLLLSLVTAFAGFIFAAPGATVVSGMGDVREWGRTSLAGPLLNLLEGGAFLGAALAVWPLAHSADAWTLLVLLAFINGWFAAFNLVPIGPLDGRKVLRWNTAVWGVGFAVAASFTAGMYVLLLSPPF